MILFNRELEVYQDHEHNYITNGEEIQMVNSGYSALRRVVYDL